MNELAMIVTGIGLVAMALADLFAAFGWVLVIVAAFAGWVLVTSAELKGAA